MSSVSAVNSGEGFSLLALPLTVNGPLDRIFSYVGIRGLGALSSVCKQIHLLVVDSGAKGGGRHFWQGSIESEMVAAFQQGPKRWSIIDKSVWEASPTLSKFLEDHDLKIPDQMAHHCYYKTMFLGLNALNLLNTQGNAGMTYIELPKGITSRMLCDLLAKAMGKGRGSGFVIDKFPREYWDYPIRKPYAFSITNTGIEGSLEKSINQKIEILRINGCEMPDGIEQISLLALTYILTKEKFGKGDYLYSNISNVRYSSVWVGDQDFEIGCFSDEGIDIYKGYCTNHGVGAVRRFLPSLPQPADS
jgi:hypothetical protein